MSYNLARPINNVLNSIFDNQFMNSALKLFLVLYIGFAAPKLPQRFARMFNNRYFKFVWIYLIAYMVSRDVSLALISAIALVVTLQTVRMYEQDELSLNKVRNIANNSLGDVVSGITDIIEDAKDYIMGEKKLSHKAPKMAAPEVVPEEIVTMDDLYNNSEYASTDALQLEGDSGDTYDPSLLSSPTLDNAGHLSTVFTDTSFDMTNYGIIQQPCM